MDFFSSDFGYAIQALFHSIPIIVAAKVWWEHEKFKKEVKSSSKKQTEKLLDHVDENTNMTFTILKLLLFITVYLSIDTFFSLNKIQKNAASTEVNTERIISEIKTLQNIKENTDRLMVYHSFPDIKKIKDKFNPVLATTFSSYIEENAKFFEEGISYDKVTFHMDRFLNAYIKSLEYANDKYKNPTIVATSLADTNYFWSWGNQPLSVTEEQIRRFTQKGGIMKRVFFVEDDWKTNPITMSILNRQIDSLGVKEVWVINQRYVTTKKYFVVNAEKQFTWEVIISSKQKIEYGTYSTRPDDIENYLNEFNHLLSNPNRHLFRSLNAN